MLPIVRKITSVVILFLALNAGAQEPYIVKPTVQDCVNVRDDSNTSANIVTCLSAGTSVSVLSSRPYWREIEFGQAQPGWIAKKFIIPSPTPPVEPVPDPLPTNMWLTVHFIDVGQGDAVWINTADDSVDGNGRGEGRNSLIDG